MNNSDLSRLRTLAEAGDPYAQNALGAYLAQKGGRKNETAALYWYLEAVDQGYVDSMWNAATMLLNGEGGYKNIELGLLLTEVAAEHGNSSACLFLSSCYDSGRYGFEPNAELAKRWADAAWSMSDLPDFTEPIEFAQYLKERPAKPT